MGVLEHWLSTRAISPPRGHLAMSGDIFIITFGGKGVLLTSMLIVLQCSGQPPQRRTVQLKMSIVPRLRNSALEEKIED